MGQDHSKETSQLSASDNNNTLAGGPVCLDCDKSTQKDLPLESTSSNGQPCEELYSKVTACMDKHHGQIAPCTHEWKAFQECHERNRKVR
jgi:hypothetical protein